MKKILCPVDFSECSLNAVEFATRIAEAHHASLTLFHVYSEEEFSKISLEGAFTPGENESNKDYAQRLLDQTVNTIIHESKPNGLSYCDYHFSEGPLANQIVEYAEEHDFSWIVMGTAGVSDIEEYYAGSNTVKVIQRSQKPVLCVPQKAGFKPFKHMVYATDFHEEDIKCLQILSAFAIPFNASIEVLHVTDKDRILEKAEYQEFMDRIESYVAYQDLKFSMKTAKDTPHGLDDFMFEHNGDLLALLTRHRNFFEKLFSQSTTTQLSYFASYPLLAFKSD